MCWVIPPASPDDDLGLANRVEQRRLTVVDVAHDGNDRRSRHEILLLVAEDQLRRPRTAVLTISTFFSNSSAITPIASSDSVWVSVAISPICISFLITSAT